VNVAVDVGRSSVKVAWSGITSKKGYFSLPSVIATSLSSFSTSTVNMFSDEDIAQLEVVSTQGGWNKGFSKFFLFGEQATKQGQNIMSFSEGSTFHRFGVASVLYGVARCVFEALGYGDKEIHLAINLTYLNNEASEFYASALKGEHTVILGWGNGGSVETQEITFTIEELLCFQQGYASLFNFIGSSEWETSKGQGLIIDIGRRTVDLSKVENHTLVLGNSIEAGTEGLLDKLNREVVKAGFTVPLGHLERCFIDHGLTFRSLSGGSLQPWALLKEKFLVDYAKGLLVYAMNFLGDAPLDYVLLCGGGAYIVEGYFKKAIGVPFLGIKDYVFGNCEGMLKFLAEV
jgi:hypothetical protein